MTQLEPCGWNVEVCEDCCTQEVSGLDPAQWESIQAAAVSFLWKATGKQYGLCENTYRPCRRNCDGTSWGWPVGVPFIPWRVNGQWTNLSCGSCPGECGCGGPVSEIRIPSTAAVTGIRVDGADLDPEATVMVYDRYRIVRADGGEWPTCQNLAAPDDEAGTWSVTVQQGLPVPDGGEWIAGVLACEFAKACLGSKDCRLPRNVSQLARQGVTVVFEQFANLPDMLTGLFEVDAWIVGARSTRWQAPSVTSLDVKLPAQLTWPVVGAV
jgi:hypothetical protein